MPIIEEKARETDGKVAEYRLSTDQVALPNTYGAVQLPSDTIDISGVTVILNGAPYPLSRTHRDDYQTVSFPNSPGMPVLFWLSKSQPPESAFQTHSLGDDYVPSLRFDDPLNTQNLLMFPAWPVGSAPAYNGEGPFLVLWPRNNLGATKVVVTRVRQIKMPNAMGDQMDIARPWMETTVRGLAAAIAEKYNPDIWPRLVQRFETMLANGSSEEDKHPIQVVHRAYGWGRGRRH